MSKKIRFGDVYKSEDPDKSDVRYKKWLKDYLLEHGYKGVKFVEVRITLNDIEAITEDNVTWYFEVKGTTTPRALIQTYGNELITGLENPDVFRVALVRYFDGVFQEPLFFGILKWISLFPIQMPALKGSLYTGGWTQEQVDNDVFVKRQKRRDTTLMGNAELFIEAKEMHEKYLQKQNDSNIGIFKFCEELKDK
tara:strand:- start:87 stop:671 length:585 start_codon:yes stop_codon:yes gene_type:complete